MESLDYWRLNDELSVVHAALLIAGFNPADYSYVEDWEPHNRPAEYQAAFSALKNAIMAKRLPATVRHGAKYKGFIEWLENVEEEPNYDEDVARINGSSYIYKQEPDWFLTTIYLECLRDWLIKRGFKPRFFFPTATNKPDYLDIQHPNYSPKLAAAIEAWLAVTDTPELSKAKSIKQTIMIWLRSHAGRFGLIKDDGNPNESGIEEVAKVANWETKGGAPRTPEG